MIAEQDIPGFFADRVDLKLEEYVLLRYVFELSPDIKNPKLIAAAMASEQSTAQWNRPGNPEDLRGKFGAKVISLKEKGNRFFEIEIAHPHRNFGSRIPNFLSAAAGEGAFYCPGIQKVRWTDFTFPDSLTAKFAGPKFGLPGIRKILGVNGRPIFIGVVKPNIGLSPQEFAETAYQSWIGGLDIAKDDEMLADADDSSLEKRTLLTGKARLKAEKETGEKKIYIANITDEWNALDKLYETAVKNGANTVMINAIMTGLPMLRSLCGRSVVPVMSHFTGTACLSQIPDFGISSLVLTKLQRLAGADIIGLAGFGERMKTTDAEVLDTIKACLEPWGKILPSLPVPGGSDTAETLPSVYRKVGHADFGFISGRGIFGHPDGVAAGAKTLREAWEKLRNLSS
jgi:ribulose-bisphosphate carboxylase large chain